MTQDLRFVIELGGVAAGLVVAVNNHYRFFASRKEYAPLEQRLFRSPADAEETCKKLHESGLRDPDRS